MSDEMFVRCCAPTLAGIKTGSMFSCEYADREEMTDELRRLNRVLAPGGMCLLPLRFHDGKALLYLFRPDSLQRDMKNRAAREILDAAGYSGLRYQQCIRRLICRIGAGKEFPHEIGLFLSYPPEDVRGFIEHKGRGFLCCGLWKVYSDADTSMTLFKRYADCTARFCTRLASGVPMADILEAV